MIVDMVADLHGFYPELEGGDLLIVAGDLTARDAEYEYVEKLIPWFLDNQLKYKKIIFIAGNHDNWIQRNISPENRLMGAEYLCDSGIEFEGLKIWGSPWTKRFPGMNPQCMAFTVDTEEQLAEKWALIPDNVDILVTHSPAYDHLDHIKNKWNDRVAVGSESLYWQITERIVPKIHVFGHVHEEYGVEIENDFYPPVSSDYKVIKFINASHVNEHYQPVNKPIRVIL